jgi:hypothetical protein
MGHRVVRRVAVNVVVAYGAVGLVTLAMGLVLTSGDPGDSASASLVPALWGAAWVTVALIGWLLPIVLFGAVLLDLALRVIRWPRLVVATLSATPLAFSLIAEARDRWLPIWCLLVGLLVARLMCVPPRAVGPSQLRPLRDELPPLRL